MTATVGVVAGAAITFGATRNGRTDHVATPPTVSTQDAVSPPPIPPAAQTMAPTPPSGTALQPNEGATGGPDCGVNLAAPQVIAAVKQLPPYPGIDRAWSTNPSMFEGNYNPCATLSTALVTVEMATGSSPVTALMFHNGDYLGTATFKAYGFTTLDSVRTTDDTVVLDYKAPGFATPARPPG